MEYVLRAVNKKTLTPNISLVWILHFISFKTLKTLNLQHSSLKGLKHIENPEITVYKTWYPIQGTIKT